MQRGSVLSKHSCQVRVGGPHKPVSLWTLRFTGNSRPAGRRARRFGLSRAGGRAPASGMPSNFACPDHEQTPLASGRASGGPPGFPAASFSWSAAQHQSCPASYRSFWDPK